MMSSMETKLEAKNKIVAKQLAELFYLQLNRSSNKCNEFSKGGDLDERQGTREVLREGYKKSSKRSKQQKHS